MQVPGSFDEENTLSEWKELKAHVSDLRMRVISRANEVVGDDKGVIWLSEKIEGYSDWIGAYFNDRPSYVTWHILIGSSVYNYEDAPLLDFPEPYSVAGFLEGCLEELDQIGKRKR